jgi:hypothetical protein
MMVMVPTSDELWANNAFEGLENIITNDIVIMIMFFEKIEFKAMIVSM